MSSSILAAIVCLSITAACGADSLAFEETKYAAEIPGVGTLTLELRKEYQGKRAASFLWVFEQLQGNWELKGGKVLFYRRPAYGQDVEAGPALTLIPQPDGSLAFGEGGVLGPDDAGFFAQYPLRPATDRKSPEYAAFYKAREQPQHFKKRGELLPLAESFPKPFMDASALLFRDREHTIIALLKYPQLGQAVLDVVGDGLLGGDAGQGAFFVLPVLGAHPHLSDRLQKKLFARPKEPAVWRAVACNPSAPRSFYPEYLKRIRENDKNIRFGVARDRNAPREAWELALAPGEPEVLEEFSRNPSAPPDLLEKISKNLTLRDPVGLAANVATPPDVLNRLAESTDKQVLWAVKRNASAPPEAVERVLRTLAASPGADLRASCVDDPRLPQDLIPKLAKDPSIQVRLVLAMNKAVPLPILEELAKDPYRMVSERARDNIKDHFPETYAARQAQWTPLEKLNPNNNLVQDFEDAVKAGDVTRARELLASTGDPDIKPNPSTIVGIILASNFEPFKDLLKETITAGGGGAAESMIINPNLKPSQLRWMVEEKLLSPTLGQRVVLFSTEKGRQDLLQEAKNLSLLAGAPQSLKNAALFTATALRHKDQVEFWLAEGAVPDQPVRENLAAVDIAAKMYSIDLLKRLDSKGKYTSLVAEISREFPPSPKSPLLGAWSNKREGFSTVAFSLGPDGTGYMGASVMSFPILWKSDGPDALTLVIIGPNGPERDKPVRLKHDAAQDILLTDKTAGPNAFLQGDDPSPFYRIGKQEAER